MKLAATLRAIPEMQMVPGWRHMAAASLIRGNKSALTLRILKTF